MPTVTINSLLTGKNVTDFNLFEHSCAIVFDGDYQLHVEGLLRFVGNDGAFVSVEDHNQQFGLKVPFNAEEAIGNEIKGKAVQAARIDNKTGDLRVVVDTGVIEALATSSGYESFQLFGPQDFFLVGIGGKQAE